MLAVLVVMTLTLFGAVVAEMPKEIREKFEASKKATDAAIQTLWDRWQISDYPNFLRSAAISHTSWEVMKLKFQRKILRVALGRETEEDKTFIISFMGSSVTAGHDTAFNSSFPVLTGEFMKPAFEDLGIELITRNAAMGNNPCEPYDICPQTFSGKSTYSYTHTHAYIHIHVYICIYMHILMHTYTNTNPHTNIHSTQTNIHILTN
jgi:hypothetical protein